MRHASPAAFVRFCDQQGIKLLLQLDGNSFHVGVSTTQGTPPDATADYITAYLRQHRQEVVALLRPPAAAPESVLDTALAAARAGTLPDARVTLCPGTTTDTPNLWLPLAVARLEHYKARANVLRSQCDVSGAARQQEHADTTLDSLNNFLAWYKTACGISENNL